MFQPLYSPERAHALVAVGVMRETAGTGQSRERGHQQPRQSEETFNQPRPPDEAQA